MSLENPYTPSSSRQMSAGHQHQPRLLGTLVCHFILFTCLSAIGWWCTFAYAEGVASTRETVREDPGYLLHVLLISASGCLPSSIALGIAGRYRRIRLMKAALLGATTFIAGFWVYQLIYNYGPHWLALAAYNLGEYAQVAVYAVLSAMVSLVAGTQSRSMP